MQYHLDTIPVWEAMEWQRECPLCGLARKTEAEEIERVLGASVMEPGERIKVNARGICREHHQMMFAKQNRLSHALLMESHHKEQLDTLHKLQSLSASGAGKPSLFSKRTLAEEISSTLAGMHAHCVVCEKIDIHMSRYHYTFLHLWRADKAFRKAWQEGKGICLPHVQSLMEQSKKVLSRKEQSAFVSEALAHLIHALEIDAADLAHFTRKFDYRNQSMPWGESKTALERMVNRLRGWCLGDEPYPIKER